MFTAAGAPKPTGSDVFGSPTCTTCDEDRLRVGLDPLAGVSDKYTCLDQNYNAYTRTDIRNAVVARFKLLFALAADKLTPAQRQRIFALYESHPASEPACGKAQVIDTTKLECLAATCTPPPGHVSIAPATSAELDAWAATRGTGMVHPFTQEVLDAIVETVKRPK